MLMGWEETKNNRIICVHSHHPVADTCGWTGKYKDVQSMCWGREALLNFADLQYQVWTPIRSYKALVRKEYADLG